MSSSLFKTPIIVAAAAMIVYATPIPFDAHSYRAFDWSTHYRLDRPSVFEPLDVHNLSLQFTNRFHYTDDTSQVGNRWIIHFADSIVFRDIEFNFRIRADGLGERVRDAGWTSQRAGDANDPGFVYDPDRIVAYYTPNEYFRFGFGKERYNWGPLELGGLLLSDYNEGITGFYQQYALGGFTLRGVTGQLNSIGSTSKPPIIHRYYTASHLEYYKENYGAALGQSMLYVGEGRSMELQYFLPFYIFHYGQMTSQRGYGNAGQNSVGSLDGYAKIYKLPLHVYGELYVDDFQGHSDSVSQSVQNTVSWMAGLRLVGAEPWYGFIEGGKISTYTYNHKDIAKVYMYTYTSKGKEHPKSYLGSPLGPDQQLLWGKFGREFSISAGWSQDTIAADLNFWLRRSGERHGRDTLFTIGNLKNTRGDKQPYGVVEDELALWASVSYRKFYSEFEFRGGMTTYKNRHNIEGAKRETYPFFGMFLTTGVSSSAVK